MIMSMHAWMYECAGGGLLWGGGGGGGLEGWRAVLPYMGYMSGADIESIIFVSLSLKQALQISVSIWKRVYCLPILTLEHAAPPFTSVTSQWVQPLSCMLAQIFVFAPLGGPLQPLQDSSSQYFISINFASNGQWKIEKNNIRC